MADLGNISFSVDVDTSRLNRVDQEVRNVTSTVSKLAVAITAAFSAQRIAAYANSWIEVNNKLVNSVKEHEKLADVTQRVFEISQRSRSELEATADLYSRVERATRDLGVSTQEIGDLTETVAKAMSVSGASTAEASSTMIQLSQALASGVLRGQEFNSISENGSRLMKALADATKKPIGVLRNMAAEGKLTADIVIKAILSQKDVIDNEFNNTVMTMGQAFVVASNNAKEFVGTTSSVVGGIQVFNNTLVLLSENLDMIANAGMLVATVMGARFAGAITTAIQAQLASSAAAQAQAASHLQAAQAAVAEAQAQVTSATSTRAKLTIDNLAAQAAIAKAEAELAVAQANGFSVTQQTKLNAARATAAATATALAGSETALATAVNNLNAALVRQSAAANTASRSLTALKGALSFIGGPTGLAFLAGAGLFYFFQNMQQARQEAIELANSTNQLADTLNELSKIQLQAKVIEWKESLNTLEDALESQKISLKDVEGVIAKYKDEMENAGYGASYMARMQEKLTEKENLRVKMLAKIESLQENVSKTSNLLSVSLGVLNDQSSAVVDEMTNELRAATPLETIMIQLNKAFNLATKSKQSYNSVKLEVAGDISDAQKLIQNLQNETEQLQAQAGLQRELVKAKQDAIKAGATETELAQILSLTSANETLKTAEEERNKAVKSGTKETNRADDIIKNLRNSVDELRASQSGLNNEYEKQRVIQDLGASASQAQIQEAISLIDQRLALEQRGGALEIINAQQTVESINQIRQQGLNAIDSLLAEEIISAEQASDAKLQIERDFQQSRAEIAQQKAVTPRMEELGAISPIQQMYNEHQQKLALIQSFNAQTVAEEDLKNQQLTALNNQFEQAKRDQAWDTWKNQSTINDMLGSAFEGIASTASNALTGFISGQSTAIEMVQQLGRVIVNSLINSLVQMGIEAAKNAIIGQTMGTAIAAASIAQAGLVGAAWSPAAMAASIATLGGATLTGSTAFTTAMAGAKTLSVVGGRRTGGPVTGGSMYEVGEGNRPEILRANDGKQYMIPGNNGRVIGNKELEAGSGAPVININVINNSQANARINSTTENGQTTIEVLMSDVAEGGPFAQQLQSSFNIERKAN